MNPAFRWSIPTWIFFSVLVAMNSAKGAEDTKLLDEIRAANQGIVTAFQNGQAAQVAGAFTPSGEWISEEGVIYQGRTEMETLLGQFFQQYPKATLAIETESIRQVAPQVLLEEGTRQITAQDGTSRARLRYVAVRTQVDGKWLIASLREVNDEPLPTAHDHLQALSWLVGDWVNEGSDAVVKIQFRWSEDQNYLLGEYRVITGGEESSTSTQRIGWDPHQQKIRSWIFESDGGYSQGVWTSTEQGWMIQSQSVLADGQTGSAIVTLQPQDDKQFRFHAEQRIVGDTLEPPITVTISRQPPSANQ